MSQLYKLQIVLVPPSSRFSIINPTQHNNGNSAANSTVIQTIPTYTSDLHKNNGNTVNANVNTIGPFANNNNGGNNKIVNRNNINSASTNISTRSEFAREGDIQAAHYILRANPNPNFSPSTSGVFNTSINPFITSPAQPASQRFYKKFLHLISPTKSLFQLSEEIIAKCSKLYPNLKSRIDIISLQDSDECDLDPDFTVGEIFNFNNTVYVILKGELEFFDDDGKGVIENEANLSPYQLRRKRKTESDGTPATINNPSTDMNHITGPPTITIQKKRKTNDNNSDDQVQQQTLRISTPLANEIFPSSRIITTNAKIQNNKPSSLTSINVNIEKPNDHDYNIDDLLEDRSILPPPPPQSPPIRISSRIEAKRIVSFTGDEDAVSRSEQVDPDKTKRTTPMKSPNAYLTNNNRNNNNNANGNSNGNKTSIFNATPNRFTMTGQRVVSANNTVIHNPSNRVASTPLTTHIQPWNDTTTKKEKRITSGMLVIPEPKISEVEREMQEGPSSPAGILPLKSDRIPMKKQAYIQDLEYASPSSSSSSSPSSPPPPPSSNTFRTTDPTVAKENQQNNVIGNTSNTNDKKIIASPPLHRGSTSSDESVKRTPMGKPSIDDMDSPTKKSSVRDSLSQDEVQLAKLPTVRKTSIEEKLNNKQRIQENEETVSGEHIDGLNLKMVGSDNNQQPEQSINVTTRKEDFSDSDSSTAAANDSTIHLKNNIKKIDTTNLMQDNETQEGGKKYQAFDISLHKEELLSMLNGNKFVIPPKLKRKTRNVENNVGAEKTSSSKRKPYTTILNIDLDNSKPDPRNILPKGTSRSAARKATKLITSNKEKTIDSSYDSSATSSNSPESSSSSSSESETTSGNTSDDITEDSYTDDEKKADTIKQLKDLNVNPLKEDIRRSSSSPPSILPFQQKTEPITTSEKLPATTSIIQSGTKSNFDSPKKSGVVVAGNVEKSLTGDEKPPVKSHDVPKTSNSTKKSTAEYESKKNEIQTTNHVVASPDASKKSIVETTNKTSIKSMAPSVHKKLSVPLANKGKKPAFDKSTKIGVKLTNIDSDSDSDSSSSFDSESDSDSSNDKAFIAKKYAVQLQQNKSKLGTRIGLRESNNNQSGVKNYPSAEIIDDSDDGLSTESESTTGSDDSGTESENEHLNYLKKNQENELKRKEQLKELDLKRKKELEEKKEELRIKIREAERLSRIRKREEELAKNKAKKEEELAKDKAKKEEELAKQKEEKAVQYKAEMRTNKQERQQEQQQLEGKKKEGTKLRKQIVQELKKKTTQETLHNSGKGNQIIEEKKNTGKKSQKEVNKIIDTVKGKETIRAPKKNEKAYKIDTEDKITYIPNTEESIPNNLNANSKVESSIQPSHVVKEKNLPLEFDSDSSQDSSDDDDEAEEENKGRNKPRRGIVAKPKGAVTRIVPTKSAFETDFMDDIHDIAQSTQKNNSSPVRESPSIPKPMNPSVSLKRKLASPTLNSNSRLKKTRSSLNTLSDLAQRGVPEVKEKANNTVGSKKVSSPLIASSNEEESDSEDSEDSGDSDDSSSDESSSNDSSDSDSKNNTKFINAKGLNKRKKKSNSGFASLIKDSKKNSSMVL
ncbi:uncharacterized protein SCODWIG_01533 [Saccharomycodes ludwigii]|uniref:Nucleolar protein Dnt1-like N-terminal domain-containing protein n=1 Tax=Saccharomycodes ludwigii TaxID=36035 RepID=A0A376B571_9ASCO|nr:uncharacterized protein SCODWIG_01533 [Saccharomycodes ludwigii]